MDFDANNYSVTVRRVTGDGESLFEATVLELPDIRGYGDSAAEAHRVAVEAIDALRESAELDYDEFPPPAPAETEYSGRVTLRLPKSVHRAASLAAAAEGVSINSYIATTVAAGLKRTIGELRAVNDAIEAFRVAVAVTTAREVSRPSVLSLPCAGAGNAWDSMQAFGNSEIYGTYVGLPDHQVTVTGTGTPIVAGWGWPSIPGALVRKSAEERRSA